MAHSGLSSRNALGRSLIFIALCAPLASLASCAAVGGPLLQPEVNGLVVAGRPALAAAKITAGPADYGSGNYVLYHLDRALILQLTGDFAGSAASLEKAKARDEELYTRSLTNEASTWAVNDNMAPYRAPAYERVLMNVFQMLNYLQMGQLDEAIVEARDLDARFPVVPGQERRRFEDNGFARLLAGILYEAAGTPQDLDDARIAYTQALAVYDAYYGGKQVPLVLQQGLIRLAEMSGDADLGTYRARFPGVRSGGTRPGAATVYLIGAAGFSPIRVPEIIPVPADRGFIVKITFPRFMRRLYEAYSSRLVLAGGGWAPVYVDTEPCLDIEELAARDLESRKAATLSKAVIRPALKYLVERNQKEAIEKKHGRVTADVFGIFSNLYNIYTEQADLRSWQALPARLSVARVEVPAGAYDLRVEDLDQGGAVVSVEDRGPSVLEAGKTYFLVRRSLR